MFEILILGDEALRSYIAFPFVRGVLQSFVVDLKLYVRLSLCGDSVRRADIFGVNGGGDGGVTGRSNGRVLIG